MIERVCVTTEEAQATMLHLYGLDPPWPYLGPCWPKAYGRPHVFAAEGARVGEGYQYLTRARMVRTMWVQTVLRRARKNVSRQEEEERQQIESRENERIRHDLIPLWYRFEGCRTDQVPPTWCAPPWAKGHRLDAKKYNNDVVDAADASKFRGRNSDLVEAGVWDQIDRIAGSKGSYGKVPVTFGAMPPRVIDLPSKTASEGDWGMMSPTSHHPQRSSAAGRHRSSDSRSGSPADPSSGSSDEDVDICSLSSYHSNAERSTNVSPAPIKSDASLAEQTGDAQTIERGGSMPMKDDSHATEPLGPSSHSDESPPSERQPAKRAGWDATAIPFVSTAAALLAANESEDEDEEALVNAIATSQARLLTDLQHVRSRSRSNVSTESDAYVGDDEDASDGASTESRAIAGVPILQGDHSHVADSEESLESDHDDRSEVEIVRRETSPSNAAALEEVRSMLEVLAETETEPKLPTVPVPLPATQSRIAPSWAAVASRGNIGKENIDLKTSPRPSFSRSPALDPDFQVTVPEGW